MRDFFIRLFFYNDPSFGYLPRLFGLENFESQTRYPFWILPALALALAVAAYFVGSVNFALVISKLFYHDDVRKYGSHNAGTTNMKRVFGAKAAVLTLLGDFLKGAVMVLIPKLLICQSAAYLAGFFCVLGHCFPVYFRFRGGKGVATAFAAVLVLEPLVGLILFAVFALVVLGSKYISLGSIMAALFFPLVLDRYIRLIYEIPPTMLISMSAMLMMLLIIFMHRTNIKRLWAGEENKFSFKKQPADGSAPSTPSAPSKPSKPSDGGNDPSHRGSKGQSGKGGSGRKGK